MKKMNKLNMLIIVAVMLGIVVLPAAPELAFGGKAFVERTGQTECFGEEWPPIPCADTGQDGDLQRGVRWPKPRFKDLGNGWVLDRLTWLQWLKDANCASTIGVDPDGIMDWQSALDFVSDLNDGVHDCGQTNHHWKHARLPNIRELHSLIYYNQVVPAVPDTAGTSNCKDGDPFNHVQCVNAESYWSSSSFVFALHNAWNVNMCSGHVDLSDKTDDRNHVWPVRGGN